MQILKLESLDVLSRCPTPICISYFHVNKIDRIGINSKKKSILFNKIINKYLPLLTIPSNVIKLHQIYYCQPQNLYTCKTKEKCQFEKIE